MENTMVRRILGKDESYKRRIGIVVGGVVAGVLALVAVLIWMGLRDRPEPEALQLAYPYGFEGMVGTKGERAPPASEVSYHYEGEVIPCNGFSTCLKYRYELDSFSGYMILGKLPDGHWQRTSDEGMPFRPPMVFE